MGRLRLGLVGVGKIARDQHLPVIAASGDFVLAACASRNAGVDGVPGFSDVEAMLDAGPALDCVAVCTPPQAHFRAALTALRRGCHVLLEKPPAATLYEFTALRSAAESAGRSLFQSWHSRFAAGVDAARDWLRTRTVLSGRIAWKEDVRVWHPGQRWIWEPGGLGVFDPGINALAILTEILPEEVFVDSAVLSVPENRATPIAASLVLRTAGGAGIGVDFDFRQSGAEAWDIGIATPDGDILLSRGGAALAIDGRPVALPERGTEYERVYARFADLCANGRSDADGRPFQLVGDAFLVGRQVSVPPFVD